MSAPRTFAETAKRAIERWENKKRPPPELISEERLAAPCTLPRAIAPWGPMSEEKL